MCCARSEDSSAPLTQFCASAGWAGKRRGHCRIAGWQASLGPFPAFGIYFLHHLPYHDRDVLGPASFIPHQRKHSIAWRPHLTPNKGTVHPAAVASFKRRHRHLIATILLVAFRLIQHKPSAPPAPLHLHAQTRPQQHSTSMSS